MVGSIGSGLHISDNSGSNTNTWFSESKVCFTENIQNPGPGANLDLYAKNSVFGGVALAANYVVNWVTIASTTASTGDTATISLDVGGTGAGGGDFTLQAALENGSTIAMAMAAAGDRVPKSFTSRRLFLNLVTGGSFSATADLQVTWCATLV